MDPNRAPQCIDAAVGDLMIGYASGTLGPEERAAFEAHRAACLACEEQLDPMRRLLGALAMLPSPPSAATTGSFGSRSAQRRRTTLAVAALVGLACVWMLMPAPAPPIEDGIAAEIGALRARIARLEQQNAEILRAVESGPAPGASVQPIYGRMPIPPNL